MCTKGAPPTILIPCSSMKDCHCPLVILVVASVLLSTNLPLACANEFCDDLDGLFMPELEAIMADPILRKVDLEDGNDTEECLNVNRTNDPPPCSSLLYALHESNDSSVGTVTSNLRLDLGPGVYRTINRTANIINSDRVAIVGAGISCTFFVCGINGSDDVPCTYPNFQIRNSTRVYISGITFTGCGPITSSVFMGQSDFVFIDKCSFENAISPPLLIYNTPSVKITNTTFLNNIPMELPPDIARNTCYFSGGANTTIFLDNRTTSGGISLFMEGASTKVLIENCSFINNTGRNDPDVVLARRSDRNGHGGAMNLRLRNSTNSTVCIKKTTFLNNSAEAHGGALAITMASYAERNRFILSESHFEGNKCLINKCTGGAVGINFFSGTMYNTIWFLDSNFTKNQANSSGAVALSTSVSAELSEDGLSDILILRNCWFVQNEAFFEGTALGVFSLSNTNQIGMPVDICDCHFHMNQGSGGSGDTTAVTVYRVLLTFYGNNSFYENFGGGISLLSSRMDVRREVIFDGNRAVFGAGMAMSGRSLILLHEGSKVFFINNIATELGAGLYVESTSSDFILSVLNTGCFIRYYSTLVDLPPTQWDAQVTFENNTAMVAGAAIYASDMSRCLWLGGLPGSYTIFQISPEQGSPFLFVNNTLTSGGSALRGTVSNETLATNPSSIRAESEHTEVARDELLSFYLSSEDQLGNFREAVWSLDAPGAGEDQEQELLGSLSSNRTVFSYNVPIKDEIFFNQNVDVVNNTANFSIAFTLLQSEAAAATTELMLRSCHPGYQFNGETNTCTCSKTRRIVRCDANNRYFYARDGSWVGVHSDSTPYFANTIPGFLNCSRLGSLTGCLFKYDSPNEQCASGREGHLCGDCQPNYGVSFDLRSCFSDCGYGGKILFIFICVITPLLSLAIIYFDFPIPNELKCVIFYAQVIGVIYRSTPYLIDDTATSNATFRRFFDFLINMLGFAMPFPLCLHEDLPVVLVALLGYIPPLLATVTAIAYGISANRVKKLSHRENYGFHGFYFLIIFVYKYFVDTSFIFVSCTNLDGESVFLYQGTQKCLDFPFILLVVFGAVLLVLFGIVLPIYVLKVIYAPKKLIHVHNALTHGLKNGRQYLWYGVWDIWRRLLFVGANLFITITTPSVVLFIHSMLIMVCLSVLCIVKPYKKYHINIMEGLVILSLFATTLSIYDRDDLYVGRTVALVSIAVPFLYGGLFILYRAVKMIFRKFWPMVDVRWHLGEKLRQTWLGKCWGMFVRAKGMTVSFIEKSDLKEETNGLEDAWNLEVVQPMREKDLQNSMAEMPYAPELREALLEDVFT